MDIYWDMPHFFPILTQEPQIHHTVWAEVRINPELASRQDIRDALFELVVARTRNIIQAFPERQTHLTFQYHPSEIASIDYVLSQGGVYAEGVFRLMRDLSCELPVMPSPQGIDIRLWRMESESEQRAYIQARNEAFPEAPLTLADWQDFLHSPVGQTGTTIAAFDGNEIVGSVTVYWDEMISQQLGTRAGFTEYIFVREKWRKRGIAAFLISQGLSYLKEHDRQAAYLEVKALNQQALSLYDRLGYKLVDETHLYIIEL